MRLSNKWDYNNLVWKDEAGVPDNPPYVKMNSIWIRGLDVLSEKKKKPQFLEWNRHTFSYL